jgi:phosphatidylserine/phosphatidylglycerophosphate/cardiolipin synthase-like enzyme
MDSNSANIIGQAINDAYNRGVSVRVIAEGGNENAGLQSLHPGIPVLRSPTLAFYFGLMHNKFLIVDANSNDPLLPIVMTGSTNWTTNQLNTDRNNLVFIQDKSLAKVYTMEFEEMWGSSGLLPDTTLSRFGPDKKDNTPHVLNIGGRKVEVYFSPSDNVNSQLLRTIQTADNNIYFASMVMTRTDIASQISDRVLNYGVYGAGIINDSAGGSGNSFLILQNALGANMLEFDFPGQPGIMHHKYLIADQGTSSDPLVWTGSHNWSSAATQRNDENTVIIHDPLIANQFYQEFHNMFLGNGGFLDLPDMNTGNSNAVIYPNPGNGDFTILFNALKSEITAIDIYDISGRLIKSENIQLVSGENRAGVSLANFSSGTYIIKSPGFNRPFRVVKK